MSEEVRNVRLVEWRELHFIIRGDRAAEIARTAVLKRGMPVHDLSLSFRDGLLEIEGKVRKFLSIPFRLGVREIRVEGRWIRVPLTDMSAFGFLPLPKLLLQFAPSRDLPDGVELDAARAMVSFLPDSFLPPFLDAKVERVDLVDGGVAVTLGRGGADLPPEAGIQ